MKRTLALLMTGTLAFFLGCGIEETHTIESGDGGKRDDSPPKESAAPVMVDFIAGYGLDWGFSGQLGKTSALNYTMRIKADDWGGVYRFYFCFDSSCKDKTVQYAVKCTEKVECEAYEGDVGGKAFTNKKCLYTFFHMFSPIFDGKHGIDIHVAHPDLLPDGFHNEHLAADFTDEKGRKTELKIFHFKK